MLAIGIFGLNLFKDVVQTCLIELQDKNKWDMDSLLFGKEHKLKPLGCLFCEVFNYKEFFMRKSLQENIDFGNPIWMPIFFPSSKLKSKSIKVE